LLSISGNEGYDICAEHTMTRGRIEKAVHLNVYAALVMFRS